MVKNKTSLRYIDLETAKQLHLGIANHRSNLIAQYYLELAV